MIDFTDAKRYRVREEVGRKIILRKEGNYWFDPFPISQFYDIENSEDVIRDRKKLDKMKSVEFVFTSNMKINGEKTPCLTFVELKSSVPNLTTKENVRRRTTPDAEWKNLPDVIPELYFPHFLRNKENTQQS